MTVSMRVMSAGEGYKYLLKTVASGDGNRALSTPLTRYYLEEGTPPGRWMGSGVPALGGGRIVSGDQVSEVQLQLLVGMGRDPVTGDPLGRAYEDFSTAAARVETRIATLDPSLGVVARAEAIAQIEAEEAARGTRRAVAGFDFTFSIPKAASVVWAVADAGTQARRHAGTQAIIADGARDCGHARRRNRARRRRCTGRHRRTRRNRPSVGPHTFSLRARGQFQGARVAHFDETGARVAGKLHWGKNGIDANNVPS